MDHKQRSIPGKTGSGVSRTASEEWIYIRPGLSIQNGSTVRTRRNTTIRPVHGSQVTDSEGHQWKTRKVGSLADIGGNFYTQRKYAEEKFSNVHLVGISGNRTSGTYVESVYDGNVRPCAMVGLSNYGMAFPPASDSSTSQLNQLGATAVRLASPTNSAANMSVALGELLREGLPSLPMHAWETGIGTLRNLGKGHLSIAFGLNPAGQDIAKFLNAVISADRILDQYERDAGRVVRRRWDFPLFTDQSVQVFSGVGHADYGMLDSNHLAPGPATDVNRVREIERRRWFSGSFTYYLPTDYDSRKVMARYRLLADKVLGLSLTPDTVWNLAPWTWAVDWFSNAGDVLKNVTNWTVNHQVMQYGYLMEHTIVKDTYTRPVSSFNNGAPCGATVLVTETKKRLRANPFGFGVSWEALSPFQISILSALGITRSGK